MYKIEERAGGRGSRPCGPMLAVLMLVPPRPGSSIPGRWAFPFCGGYGNASFPDRFIIRTLLFFLLLLLALPIRI